jgi:hypothetical protein
MAVAVAIPVVGDLVLARDPARDDWHGPGLAQCSAKGVGVISLVGQDVASAAGAGQERWRDGDVGDVAGCESQRDGAADDVGEGVDLGRLAAARGADRLSTRPPFPPKAERWALM